jgi:glycosyltransferase involved in cell wall biosynthesis
MRVAFITHYSDLYGANRSLLDLMAGLRAQHGVVPHVILPVEGPFQEALVKAGVDHAVVSFPSWMRPRYYMGGPHHRLRQWIAEQRKSAQRDARVRSVVPEVVQHCQRWGVEIVHSNSIVTGLGDAAARALSVPHVWHVRELYREHYGFHVDGGEHRLARALRRSAAVIATSDAVSRSLRRVMGRSRNVIRIYNGVVTRERAAELRAQADLRWSVEGPFRFAQLGLFHAGKAQLESVDALALVLKVRPDVRLVLAGEGRQEVVRHRVAELGLQEFVTFAGFVDDPLALLRTVHCVLSPSRHEAFGRSVSEAMASGIPVIGHRSGATPELIAAGVNGDLYDGGADELAARMAHWAGDREAARRAGLRGMDEVETRFTVETMVDGVMGIYRDLGAAMAR